MWTDLPTGSPEGSPLVELSSSPHDRRIDVQQGRCSHDTGRNGVREHAGTPCIMVSLGGNRAAACGIIDVPQAALVSFIGGVMACSAAKLLEAAHIDDPISAVSAHSVGGIWGLLVCGLFSRGPDFGPTQLTGLFIGGGWELLGVQVYGGLAMIGWSACVSFLLLKLLDWAMGVRVSLKVELEGLDKSEHGLCEQGDRGLGADRLARRAVWRSRLARLGVRSRDPFDDVAEPSYQSPRAESFGESPGVSPACSPACARRPQPSYVLASPPPQAEPQAEPGAAPPPSSEPGDKTAGPAGLTAHPC